MKTIQNNGITRVFSLSVEFEAVFHFKNITQDRDLAES